MQNAINFLIAIGAEIDSIHEDQSVTLIFHSAKVKIRKRVIQVEHLNDDEELNNYWVLYSKTIFPNGIMDADIAMFFHLNKVVSMDHSMVATMPKAKTA
jgi:hypothetical protein